MPRKPWMPRKRETSSNIDKLTSFSIRLRNIALQTVDEPSCSFPADLNRLGVTVDLLRVHSRFCQFPNVRYPPLDEANESAVLEMLEYLFSIAVPRKPKNRPRQYNNDDRRFPAHTAEVVKDMSLRLASILLQERFAGYITEVLHDLRRRDPWATSPFQTLSWDELDSILCDNITPSNEFATILRKASSTFGLEVSMVKWWIHQASTCLTSEPYVLSNRFHDDETVLDRLDGLYPPDELMDYRLAHTNFETYFRIGYQRKKKIYLF